MFSLGVGRAQWEDVKRRTWSTSACICSMSVSMESNFTLPRLTYYYATRGNFFDVATFSVLLLIPVFIITLFLQRYIRTGYLSGAVKG